MSNTRKVLALAVVAVVVVAVGVGGWWFFIRDDAPAEVSSEAVRETLDEEASGNASSDETDGRWTIDPNVGSFDDFSGTFAGYRIQEELANIGGNTAAGRTPNVTGGITVEANKVTEASFEVDMTTLESDDGRRDNQMRSRGLQTDTFPTATFTLTEPLELPDDASSGQELNFSAAGELTLHGVTKAVTIDLTAQLANGLIGIDGNAPVVLADYEIEPPVGLSVVSVADEGSFEFQMFLRQ